MFPDDGRDSDAVDGTFLGMKNVTVKHATSLKKKNKNSLIRRDSQRRESVSLDNDCTGYNGRRTVMWCNCLSCGKIYSLSNGSVLGGKNSRAFVENGGVCQFCGTLCLRAARVLSPDAVDGLDDGQDDTHEMRRAYELKDTLVTYDKESAARTTVIDDQNEYYDIQANAWLSDDEREEMMAKMEEKENRSAGRRDVSVVTFDLLGRKCIIVDESEAAVEHKNGGEDLKVAQEAAMRERPYGGGRSVVGPDAALVEEKGRHGALRMFPCVFDQSKDEGSIFLKYRKTAVGVDGG